MDWGLCLGTKEGYPLLRDKLFYPVWVYYWAMFSNLILRFDWLLVYVLADPNPDFHVLGFILGFFEILRRAQWACFRVENENINNFEKYRVI